MKTLPAPKTGAPPASLTMYDRLFLVFIAVVFCVVTLLGVVTRQEALKTEAAKSNGETWATWLKEASKERFEANYAYPACAGGGKANAKNPAPAPTAAAQSSENRADEAAPAEAPSPAAGIWGGCLAQLLLETSLKDVRNPFTGKAPRYIATCVPSDSRLAGDIQIEKSVATPTGSAIPFVKSNLELTDSTIEKLQLSITVCDKGGYPIKISDIEF
jgi:hypothetical protein